MKLNWTQLYVSEKMGISQTTLSRIEKGSHEDLTDEEIKKFATLLETTEAELKEITPHVSYHNNNIKGNGYVNHLTSNGGEQLQQAINHLHESSQQMVLMMQDIKADKEFLREENRQLRQKDEKWMQMLSEMQKQLVTFLSKK